MNEILVTLVIGEKAERLLECKCTNLLARMVVPTLRERYKSNGFKEVQESSSSLREEWKYVKKDSKWVVYITWITEYIRKREVWDGI